MVDITIRETYQYVKIDYGSLGKINGKIVRNIQYKWVRIHQMRNYHCKHKLLDAELTTIERATSSAIGYHFADYGCDGVLLASLIDVSTHKYCDVTFKCKKCKEIFEVRSFIKKT